MLSEPAAVTRNAQSDPGGYEGGTQTTAEALSRREESGKIADIEVLRAAAVIMVLIEHVRLNLFTWVGGPETKFYNYFGFWSGVDLFFAISGFVIAKSLIPKLDQSPDTTGFFNEALVFWLRRAYRLLPSAWLWLAIILILEVSFNRSGAFGDFRTTLEGAVAAILDVANFRTFYLFGRSNLGATFPYWSLSLEEQFYFLLPVLVFAFRRRHLAIVFMLAVASQFFLVRANTVGFGLFANQVRSDAISLGVLIALWSRHPSYRLFEPYGLKRLRMPRLAFLILLVMLLAVVGAPGLNIVWFQVGLVAAVSAAMVFIASYNGDYLCPPGPLKHVLMWIGSRSYAIYLVHIPVFLLTREIWYRIAPPGTMFGPTYTLRYSLTAGILLILAADLNYRWVEIPLRRRGAVIAASLAARTRTISSEILA